MLVSTRNPGTPVLSGYFDLTVTDNGATEIAGNIPFDASASELAASLNSLSNVGTVSVTRTMLPNGYTWSVTFDGCKIVNGNDVCNEGNIDLLAVTNHTICPVLSNEV